MNTSLPVVEELPSRLSVVEALRALDGLPRRILLDSPVVGPGVGRCSFLMADPVVTHELSAARYGTDPFAALRTLTDELPYAPQAGLPPFQGGVAGLLGYELGGCWERIQPAKWDPFQLPVLAVGLYDWVIAWDHLAGRVWLVSQGWPETDHDRRLSWATERLAAIRQRLDRPATSSAPESSGPSWSEAELAGRGLAPQYALPQLPGLTSDFTPAGYRETVARVIEYIRAGDIFQANLSQRLMHRAPCATRELYERLRAVNPAPFSGLMEWADWALLSASPERFVQVNQRVVTTRPIKGTRRRKHNVEADLFTRTELRESHKDLAENVMIVDLLRNDLSRVCAAGSIEVPQLCEVETYATVQHLVSAVQGRLPAEVSAWDLLSAVWPGGSISGAPKVRAMEIIAELEPTVRGPYCGSLFYADPHGNMDSNLLIRTFVQRHGWLQCGVGGGIVAGSDPHDEYEETLHKAAGMLAALRG